MHSSRCRYRRTWIHLINFVFQVRWLFHHKLLINRRRFVLLIRWRPHAAHLLMLWRLRVVVVRRNRWRRGDWRLSICFSVGQVGVWIVFVRQGLIPRPAACQQFSFFRVAPFHSAILKLWRVEMEIRFHGWKRRRLGICVKGHKKFHRVENENFLFRNIKLDFIPVAMPTSLSEHPHKFHNICLEQIDIFLTQILTCNEKKEKSI